MDGFRIYPAGFMFGERVSRCPLATIGGTRGEAPEPGPVAERWVGRLFNVARLAKMNIAPTGLSAGGVEALVVLDAERQKVESEHIERARKG
jgi:hypothetical protein